MAYTAVVAQLKNVRKHTNADRLKIATVTGEQIIVGLDHEDGDLGVFFPVDGRLMPEFLKLMNLNRKSELNLDPKEKGLFEENGRVRAQALRGEKSCGFWMPISTLETQFKIDAKLFVVGYEFDTINGVQICEKYVSKATKMAGKPGGNKAGTKKHIKMFLEHFDTPQLGRNLHRIHPNEKLVITEKVHGTSQRTGNVLVEEEINLPLHKSVLNFIAGNGWNRKATYKTYQTVTGTRRRRNKSSAAQVRIKFHSW
jgi:hypothetical protein